MPKLLIKALIFLLVINGLLVSLVSRPMDEETLQAYVILIRASGKPEYTPQQPLYPEFQHLSTVESLNLSSSGLTLLPSEIGRFTSLKVLALSSTLLTSLPPEIGQLDSLEQLYLKNTLLTTLPPEIGQLASLEYLYLGNTSLTSLPPEIGQLSRLQVLDLRGTPLYPRLAELEIELGLPPGFLAERQP